MTMNCKFVTLGLILASFCAFGETIDNMVSSPEAIAKWLNGKTMFKMLPGKGPENTVAVRISSDNAKLQRLAVYRFDKSSVIGKTVTVTCDIKAENIEKPKKTYLGVKFQLVVVTMDGKARYFEQLPANYRSGSYNWKGAKLTVKIPDNAKMVQLRVGLQSAVGTVLFANITCNIED